MAPPDYSFNIVSENDFRAGYIPRNHRCGEQKITNDDVILFLLQMLVQFFRDLRPAVFCHCMRTPGEEIPGVVHAITEAGSMRQLHRNMHYTRKDLLEFRMTIRRMLGIKGEQSDLMFSRELFRKLKTADFSAGVKRQQPA